MKKQLLIIFVLTAYTAIAQIPSNPVREYLFNNNLNDTSNSSSNLSVSVGSGYSFVNDRTNTVNNALSPLNAGFYGGFLTANNSNPINNIGISFWLKFEQSTNGLEPIIRMQDGTNNIFVRRISNNTIEYRLLVGNSTTVGVIQNQALLSTTDYNHIYIDIRSTPNEKDVDAYFNGSFDTSTTNTTSNNLFASNTFINIARITSSSPALNTSLDDIRIYDRSLTVNEIQQLANEGVNTCSNFVNIPDANFKAILVADPNINTDGDTEICTTEAQAYTGPIGVNSSNISDLTGIEAFTNITALECYGNQITTLDVSSNTQLTRLYCYNNLLTTLTIGQNTTINRIECSNNQLTSLDVSQCTSLLILTCASNQLTSLNVANGNNGSISTLEANSNPNLTCIQHDAGFTPPTHDGISGWLKDATASWSDNCASLSVVDVAFNNTITMYPNPANEILNITSNRNTIKNVEIYNIIGKKVIDSKSQNINISGLTNGVYITKIKSDHNRFAVKKFIKQ